MMWRIKLGHIDLCVKLLFGAVKVERSSNTALFVLFIYLFFVCSINTNKDCVSVCNGFH